MTTKSRRTKLKKQFAGKGRRALTNALTMAKASVSEARAGLIPSEETDALHVPEKLKARRTDTLIAALRLWQRAPQYPEIELAEEHGNQLTDGEIEDLIQEINLGSRPRTEINSLDTGEKQTAILDEALNVAEDILKPLLKLYSADYVSELFKAHVRCHLGEELINIEAHGHRNDSEDDEPPVTTYQELLSLALLVRAGNTEFGGLERRANEVLALRVSL
jgi:hypothetical protein